VYYALKKDPKETCGGSWYHSYPTLEKRAVGLFFHFELLPDDTHDRTMLVDNLSGEDERIRIRTTARYSFKPDTYVTAFGKLYRITGMTSTRGFARGISVPTVKTTLSLTGCASNPLSL